MIVEHVVNGIRYTLTNENIVNGNKVYPIVGGRCLDDGGFVFHNLEWNEACSGFPSKPHTVIDTNYSPYKPYSISTDYGYGPAEKYFKVIKKEEQVYKTLFDGNNKFTGLMWVEIK